LSRRRARGRAAFGRAGRLIEQGQSPKTWPGPSIRQRFFAHARHVAADTDLAFDDDVQIVATVSVLKIFVPRACDSSVVHLGDQLERPAASTRKGSIFAQLLDAIHVAERATLAW